MTRSHATCHIDHDAVSELFASASAMSHLEVVGGAIAWQLRQSSPKKSGKLSRSWRVRVAKDDDGNPAAYVGTRIPYWHIPQYGSAEVTPTRYIDTAMSRTGLAWTPLPKEA